MPKDTPNRKNSKTGLIISFLFHAVILVFFVWFAAHQGLIKLPSKMVSVKLVQEPEKTPEVEKPVAAAPRTSVAFPVRTEQPRPSVSQPAAPSTPVSTKISNNANPAPALAAPPPVEVPSLIFNDGTANEASDLDGVSQYKKYIEFTLRSRWNRPANDGDETNFAEVEVTVENDGRLIDPKWKRKSGKPEWDESVWNAILQTPKMRRAPPSGFPVSLTIRFDTVAVEDTFQN